MNVREFKAKVLSIKTEAESLTNVVDTNYINSLNVFMQDFELLVHFVEDEQNIIVLENYISKRIDNEKQCPLDILCQNFITKLSEIDSLLKKEIFDYMRPVNNSINQQGLPPLFRPHNKTQELQTLKSKLNDINLINLVSSYEILKHLDGHNKTLVIIGPNGSGKTSFANYMKGVEKHIRVIPASKPIKTSGHIPSIYNTTIATYNNEIYGGGNLSSDLLQKLIVGICTEHDNIAREYHKSKGAIIQESTFEKVKKIFDDFFEVKLDDSAFSNKQIKAKKEGCSAFEFNNMSDGERVAFFYIATVIAAPSQSFIIVDEPENHLNPAIYNKIWDRLIADRPDCQFIFISHTMEFINARSNFELVKIKEFTHPNKFKFEFLGDSLENISTECMVEILGSRKPILFCEGSKTDYDYKIYEKLFGNSYTVIPTGNCLSVENSVDACNMHASTYSIQSAIGIIDSDLKSSEEVDRLRTKNVYSLRCNEIEMLLLDESIFKAVLNRTFKSASIFDDFKEAFFNKLTERKQHIVKRLVKTQIDEKLRSSIIDDKNNRTREEFKTNLSNIFTSIDVDVLWNDSEEKVSTIIDRKDYDEALRYCCLGHTEVLVGICTRFVSNYSTIALGVLSNNEELSSEIKNKYFSEIN